MKVTVAAIAACPDLLDSTHAFEIPENLHPTAAPWPGCSALARQRPRRLPRRSTRFQFGQELIFTARRPAVLPLLGRAWIVDDEGDNVRDAAHGDRLPALPARGQGRAPAGPQHRLRRGLVRRGHDGRRSSRSSPTRSSGPRPPRRYTAGKRLYGNVEGDLLYAYDMAADGPGAPAAHLGPAGSARDDGHERATGASGSGSSGYRLTPQRELILDAVERLGHATPDEVLAEVRNQSTAVNVVDGLPHARGARGARPGPARAPQRPRPDVPLRRRPRALPPGLPELSAGQSRLTLMCCTRSSTAWPPTTASPSTSAT